MKAQFTALLFFFISSFIAGQNFTGSFELIASQENVSENSRRDTISYFFGKEKQAIIIHAQRNQPNLRLVFSTQDSTITGLFEMKGKKGGYILPMNEKYWPAMHLALQPYSVGPKSTTNYTGRQKEIENFNCREVLAESDDYNAVLWMAEEIPLTMTSVLSFQSVGAGESIEEVEQYNQFEVEGLPLEMLLKSKKGKGNVLVRLVNFNETVDPVIFSTKGHSLSKVD